MTRPGICCALCLALFLFCVWLGPPTQPEDTLLENAQPVEDFQMERGEIRSRVLHELALIIENEQEEESIRREAAQRRMVILARMEQEACLETVLGYMGYAKCAVCIGEEDVYAAIGGFRQEDLAPVLEAILRQTGRKAENVRIIPV